MNCLSKYISSQFKNPRGLSGIIICLIQNVINRAMYNNAAELINLGQNERVLDIGYGNGYLLHKLYKKQEVELYGIDISDDAKKMATKKNRKAAKDNHLHLSVGDCCSLPYEEDAFDAVTSINTVYFWQDTVKGLSEIFRTLKQGKSFYNVVYTKEYLDTIRYTQIGYKKFEPEELEEYGKQAGFTHMDRKEIMKGKGFLVIYTK